MKKNSKISVALHALIHLAQSDQARTSEDLADCVCTNPVVVRRILGALRKHGLVQSDKGHGGGWKLLKSPKSITLYDVYYALDERLLPSAPQVDSKEQCGIVHALTHTMQEFISEAETLLDSKLKNVNLQSMLPSEHFRQ